VTTNTTAGMRYQYAYDSNNALSTVKLRKPSNGDWLYQRKTVFSTTALNPHRASSRSPEIDSSGT